MPTPDVDQILFAAGQLAPDERRAYLDQACGANDQLRSELESLLAAHTAAGEFLAAPMDAARLVDAIHQSDTESPPAALPHRSIREGDRAGAYRLGRRLGEGGMGSVHLAERDDRQFEQTVAVKLLDSGLQDPEALRRFQIERQVLAGLQHPNIAQLLDGGITESGVPYLVMEYVDGLSVDQFCDQKRLSIPERLLLFRSVCAAVHYAHQNLIVHRDLKPSNILVRPDGVVKLLDFGIAKVLGPSANGDLTITGQQMMTPRYASPEQVRHRTITTASDIYSLGVLLYRLLTGRLPYDAETPPDLIHAICFAQPPLPSQIVALSPGDGVATRNPSQPVTAESLAALRQVTSRKLSRALAGDLDDIVLKALRKEPARRYASAEQFSEDLGRHLAGRPVLARPDSVRYRVEKFVRRNAPTVALGAATVLALGLGVFINATAVGVIFVLFGVLVVVAVTSTWLFIRAQRAQRESERQRDTAGKVASLLTDAIGSISPESALGRDVALLHEVLDRTAMRVDTDLPGSSPAAGSLHFAIGSAYHSINIYDKAAHHLEAALTTRLGVRPEDPDLGETFRKLGQVEFDRGNYSRAESLVSDAVGAHERDAHGSPLVHARALSTLAETLDRLGKGADAEARHREALDLLREQGCASSPQFVECLIGLGEFLTTRERVDEARGLLQEAVTRARATGNPVLIAASLAQMAFLERWIGNSEPAEALFLESLEIAKSVLPANHPRVVSSLHNLASLRQNRGDHEGAEPLYKSVLESQKQILGHQHIDVGTTLNNLAGLYRQSGRFAESEALYLQAIQIYSAAVPGHVWVGIAMGNLAVVYERMKRFEEGADLANESIEIIGRHLPSDHWRIGERRAVLGACLLGLGRTKDARVALEDALVSLQTQFGADHQVVLDCREKLREAKTGGD